MSLFTNWIKGSTSIKKDDTKESKLSEHIIGPDIEEEYNIKA